MIGHDVPDGGFSHEPSPNRKPSSSSSILPAPLVFEDEDEPRSQVHGPNVRPLVGGPGSP